MGFECVDHLRCGKLKSDMNKKLILMALGFIICLSALQLLFYFIYIFKPLDRLANKDIGTPAGIPTTSELFTPEFLNQYVTKWDETKIYYSGRLPEFSNSVNVLAVKNSSFIKQVDASYMVGGDVADITPKNTEGLYTGYDITLKNKSGDSYLERISPVEAQFAKVYMHTMVASSFSRAQRLLSDIKVGDYLIVKRITNLLNPVETNIEIEILRTK